MSAKDIATLSSEKSDELLRSRLEKEMATHSSILVEKSPMDKQAWQGYSPWGCKESDTAEQLSIAQHLVTAKPHWGFPGGSDGKESACSAADPGSIPGSGRSPEGGLGSPLQYSCLKNSVDRGPWRATVHGTAKSQTQRGN